MQQVRRLRAYLGWIALAIPLLVGCRSEGDGQNVGTLPTSTPSEALRQDAGAYAEQFGVTVEEAIARLQLQDEIGELNAALQANEADTFGGLWIEHEPDYRVVVLFTREGEKSLGPYLAGKPYAHLVEVREARYTLAELEAIYAQTTHALARLDFSANVLLDVSVNRVQVTVGDREWFESELRRAGVQLPDGVELKIVEGGSTARDKDLLLTPPVPGIAFPRQKPTEGFRVAMEAALAGTLQLEEGCLWVRSLHEGRSMLPIWPPEFTLRVEGEQALVIDGEGQAVARAGEEVYMGGGSVSVTDEWVLQQIPAACRGQYWIVGMGVRPNLNLHSDLFALDVISTTGRTILALHYKPALYEQAGERESIAGELVLYEYDRCPRLQTDWGPGPITLLWPAGWSLRAEGNTIVVVDQAGQAVARTGQAVRLSGKSILHSWESETYRRLVHELPGDCQGTYWIVEGVE